MEPTGSAVQPREKSEQAVQPIVAPLVHTLVLRHLQPEYCTFDSSTIQSLAQLANRVRNEIQEHTSGSRPLITFLIRHDNETVVTYRLEHFLQVYQQARKIQRIQIDVKDYATDQNKNKLSPRSLDLQLETTILTGTQTNMISIAGESQTWVDGVFSAFQDVITHARNRHKIVYRVSVHAIAQLLAVLTFTIYSIWLARLAAPHIPINYSELYAFIVFFLLFSNMWGYAGNVALAFVQKKNPVIELINKPPSRVTSTLFWAVVVALVANAIWYLVTFFIPGR